MQRINLLVADFIPRPERARLDQLLLGLLLLAGLGVLISFILQQQLREAQAGTQQQSQQLQQVQDEIVALGRSQSGQQLSEAARENLRREIRQQQLLLAELRQRASAATGGFSLLLRGLSEAADDDIWLTRIHATPQQFALQGMTRRADQLPRWLQQLKQQPGLQQTRIEALHVQKLSQQTGSAQTVSAQTNAAQTGPVPPALMRFSVNQPLATPANTESSR